MEADSKEAKVAAQWFYVAGAIAVLLSLFLFNADQYLTKSKRDKILGETLHELRTAQSTLGSEANVDPRVVAAEASH